MPAILIIGGEGGTIETTLETSDKAYPRPVGEVVRELSGNMSKDVGARVIQLTLFVNTDAVVNETQAKMLALLNWEQAVERQYLQTITMLNTIRG